MKATVAPQRNRVPGRPLIGPKAQAHVPQEIYDVVRKEAKARGCYASDVWREIIIQYGFPAWLAAAVPAGEA